MDGVEKLVQMNEVERMREIMDLISDKMHKQNDKDRIEMLAMLASTTAMETNLMSVNFARRVSTEATGTKTNKNKGRAIMKGVEQADNDKDKANKATSSTQSNSQSPQKQQQPNQPQQAPANTLATRTQQAIDKKKKMARKVTTGTIKPFSTI
jgi:flagellum-specific peptidoglycan hydrolase FlgJ